MSVKQSIKVTNAGLSPILSVAQGTGAIEYEFTVSDFDIPSGSAAVAYNIQPTGNIVSQTCLISGNTITVKPPAYYFLRGKNYMQFQVSRSNEDLFSFLIEVWCAPNISQPEVIVAENPSLVSQLISDVGLLSSQLDNLLSIPSGSLSTSADAALADIKTGFDGTIYDTPGDAVRGQIGELKDDLDDIRKTNVMMRFPSFSITGTGQYVNKSFEFDAVAGVEYFLSIGDIVGGKDTPYAILRLVNANGTTESSAYLNSANSNVSKVATSQSNKIRVILNGSGESDLSGETRTFSNVVLTKGTENIEVSLDENVSIDNIQTIKYLKEKAEKTNLYDEEIRTNAIWILDNESITGTGQYVNKSFDFEAEKNKKYIFSLGKCEGAKDTPYAFLRTVKADGTTIQTVTLSSKSGVIEITTTSDTEKVRLVLNGCTSSEMGGDTATFYEMMVSLTNNPYCELSNVVSLENHKDLVTLKENMTNIELYKIFKAVGVVGDSLSVAHMGSSARNVPYSWVKLFERETGESWRCFGQSGFTTLTWLSDSNGYQLANTDGNKCQCYIVGLGVNDCRTITLGSTSDITSDTSVNPSTFYGAYAKIIYLLKQINPNAKIICLTNPRTDTGGNISGFNYAIKYISSTHFAKTDNVFCLDMTAYTDDYMSGIIANDNNYIGSHYSPIGYVAIYQIMKKALSDLISENHQYFWDIYNVPYDAGNGTDATRN
mgnify:CR=1 FL=1